MAEHKNKSRAPIKPLDVPTLALSVGGLGFLRPAPGSWGSIPPVALAGLMVLAGSEASWIHAVTVVLLVVASVACVAWGGYAERRFGRKDAAEVVADETAGVCLPVLGALWAFEGMWERLFALAGAFVVFRLFDTVKPWPARRLERLPRGWGVLIDDLMAGLYSAIVMIGAGWAWRVWGAG